MEMIFGEYIAEKRLRLDLSIRGMAAELEITPSYLSDIEKGRRNPPDLDMLEKIAKILKLSKDERNTMLDYAGQDRNNVALDLPEYIMSLPAARTALRKARDKGKSNDFWNEIVEKLDQEEENN